jgi:predicted metal-binding membrane protein
MAALFALGAMSGGWMALISVMIAAERLLRGVPWPPPAPRLWVQCMARAQFRNRASVISAKLARGGLSGCPVSTRRAT